MSLKSAQLRPHHVLLLILAVQGIIGLGYAASVPLWQGHEQDYFNVIRFLVDHGRLPTPADYPAGDADIRQATQPPLYFFAAALPVALFDNDQPVPLGSHPALVCLGGTNPTLYPYLTDTSYDFPPSGAAAAAYGLRILGVLFGMAAVAFTYLAGRTLFPNQAGIALAGAALLAFEPNTLSWSAIISNDTLLLALAAANIWLCAWLLRRLDIRLLLAILFTAALAVLTRLPGWAVLGFDLLVLVAVIGRAGRRVSRRQAQIGLIGLGLLVAAGAAVALFNVTQYGNVFGRYSNLDRVIGGALGDLRVPSVTLIGILDHTRLQYAGPLQMILPRETPVRLYGWLLPLCLLAAGFGSIRALFRREASAFALLLAAALAAVALVVLRNLTAATDANTTLYNTAYIFAPLRYYTPGLPAFALLFAAGWWSLSETLLSRFNAKAQASSACTRKGAEHSLSSQSSALGTLIALAWLAVAAGGVVYHLSNRPPDPRVPALPAEAVPVERVGTPDQPHLVAYTAAASEGVVDLTLYLTADQPLTRNYAAQIEMVNASGTVINRCEVLPTGGVYPTTRWRPGEIIAAQAAIPNCAGMMPPPLDIRLGWLPASASGELTAANTASQPLLTLREPLSEAASCPPNLGTVAGSYRITRFNSPPEVRRGETYLPSLNWLVLDALPDVEVRVFIFRHAQTEYICNTASYWASQWVRGEAVYFDACTMQFPPDAPLGEYVAYAGLQDTRYHWLPATEEDGTDVYQVEVGRVVVVE